MKRDYIEFQERSIAKGYLITFRCYGTWLHGEERGSVDRRYYNRVGTAKIAPDPEKVERKAALLKRRRLFWELKNGKSLRMPLPKSALLAGTVFMRRMFAPIMLT